MNHSHSDSEDLFSMQDERHPLPFKELEALEERLADEESQKMREARGMIGTVLTECSLCHLFFPRNELDGFGGKIWCIFCEDPKSDNSHATRGVEQWAMSPQIKEEFRHSNAASMEAPDAESGD